MTSQNQPVPTPMPIAAPRKRRWSQVLLATGLLLAGSYRYSHLLRPEERRMVGMWQVSGQSGPFFGTAFEFEDDRTSSPFQVFLFETGAGNGFHPSDILCESSLEWNWRRDGTLVTLSPRFADFNSRLQRVMAMADLLRKGFGWRDEKIRFRVIHDSADEMVLENFHGSPGEEIHFSRLNAIDEKEFVLPGTKRIKRILNNSSERASGLNVP